MKSSTTQILSPKSGTAKALVTSVGVAVAGTLLLIRTRRRKAKPLTFADKALLLGGRLAAVSVIGFRAFKCEAESLSETLKDVKSQSVKVWNSEPKLTLKVK